MESAAEYCAATLVEARDRKRVQRLCQSTLPVHKTSDECEYGNAHVRARMRPRLQSNAARLFAYSAIRELFCGYALTQ
jgi:hypothetical protein